MSSEIIVVLILVVVAVAFVVWIRINSHEHDTAVPEQEIEGPKSGYDARATKPSRGVFKPRSKQR